MKTRVSKRSPTTNRALQGSPSTEWESGPDHLLRLTLCPGERHPSRHEARVPGEPQAHQQEEAQQDIDLREGEGPQLPVLLTQ